MSKWNHIITEATSAILSREALHNKLFNIMRCLDSFHLNAFAQIEMSAYSLESNLALLQIAEFVFSSRTKELQKHLLPFKYLICAD